MTDYDAALLAHLPWRTGQTGRTVHAQFGDEPTGTDPLIGVMDTQELAAETVFAHSAILAVVPIDRALAWRKGRPSGRGEGCSDG
jgi:hypothetical protein